MWDQIKKYLLSEECKPVHKFIWHDHAFLTDWTGRRYKITDEHNLGYVETIVRKIKNMEK